MLPTYFHLICCIRMYVDVKFVLVRVDNTFHTLALTSLVVCENIEIAPS